jgi:hypothetical protein
VHESGARAAAVRADYNAAIRKQILFAVIACATAVAEGATTYRVGATRVIVADDGNFCIEYPPPRAGAPHVSDAAVSRDGGKTFIGINHELQTWWPLEHRPFEKGSHLFHNFPWKQLKVSKVKWALRKTAPHHYAGELSYVVTERIDTNTLEIAVKATLDLTTTDAQPRARWPAATLFRTGHATVDETIAPDLDAISEFPLRVSLTVTRQYEGGPPTTDVYISQVEEIRVIPDATSAACRRPASYREQPPVVGMP